MTIAQDLIEAGYSRSAANDPGKLATDGELLKVLNRIYQVLYALKAVSSPEQHTTDANLVLVASEGTIPADSIDIRRVEGFSGTVTAGSPIGVIPLEEKSRGWHLAPSMYRKGAKLISLGRVGDPGAADTVKLFHIDAPTKLVALATAIDSRYPDRFEELLVVELAMYLSTKDTKRDPAEFTKLTAYRNMQLSAFFELCGLSMTALQTPHGGVIVQHLNRLLETMKGAGAG